MREKLLAVLMVVALLVVPMTAYGVVQGSPELKTSAPNNILTAGEDTTFTVTLTNEGDLDTGSSTNPSLNNEVTTARGVEASLNPGNAPIDVRTGTRVLGQLPQQQSAELPYQISVAPDAEPGTYTMELQVDYRYTSVIGEEGPGARNEKDASRTFDVTVEIDERAEIEVVSTDSTVQIGSSGTVAVTMRNTGSDAARDTTVKLESLNGDVTFGQSSSSTRFVGDWRRGETRTVEYQVRAADTAEQQRYAFQAVASYEDSDGITRQSEPLPLGVVPQPETEFALEDVSSDLRVGEERTLSGTVRNEGDTAVRDVTLEFVTENQNLQPAERSYSVGTLEPGQTAEFGYSVEVTEGAGAGPRQFSFVAEYQDSDGDTLRSDTLNARVQIRPESEVFDVQVSQAQYRPGSGGPMYVEVTNAGNETLTDISAKLFADSPISASDDEAYVSDLEPGETANITFSVSAGGGALPKDYPVSMDFQYDDEDGDTLLSNTYRVPVSVAEQQGGGGGPPLVLIGGLALLAIVAVGGYVRFR